MWSGCERSSGGWQKYTNENNIYLLDNVDNLKAGRSWDRFSNKSGKDASGMEFTDSAPDFKQNIYWGTGKNKAMFPKEEQKPWGIKVTYQAWDQWVQTGYDNGSVWADPGFTDPQSGDYSFKDGSIAKSMGFNEIIIGKFGVQSQLRYGSTFNKGL